MPLQNPYHKPSSPFIKNKVRPTINQQTITPHTRILHQCKGTGFRCVSRDVPMTTQPMRELKQSTLPGWMSHRYCYWLIPTQMYQDTPTIIAHKPLRFDSKHWTIQGAESSSAMHPLPLGLARPLMLYTL